MRCARAQGLLQRRGQAHAWLPARTHRAFLTRGFAGTASAAPPSKGGKKKGGGKKGKREAHYAHRETNFPEWYQDVIRDAELVQHGPVRGTMVLRPCAPSPRCRSPSPPRADCTLHARSLAPQSRSSERWSADAGTVPRSGSNCSQSWTHG